MSFYRTYIDKQATLILDNYTNNSKNPVFEIVRGNNLYSRYIFSFDISDLRNKFTSNGIASGIASGTVQTHKVNFYNAIRYREDLIGKQNVDGFFRDNNINLQIFSINEDFASGVNFDYIYNTGLTFSITSGTQQVPNWFYKDSLNQWNVAGIYSGTSSTILDTQTLEQGNENLEFDVTSYVQNILFNTTGNTVNLGIAYTRQYEIAITGDSSYILSYFSEYTQTFFEPYLQTITNDVIDDNRTNFYLDETNNLYLYINKPITSVDKVEIYDYEGNIINTISGTSITKLNSLTYGVSLNISSNNYPDLVNFQDLWYYTDINDNNKTYEQEFTILTRNLFDSQENAFQNAEYYMSVVGITQNEKISTSIGTKRVQVMTKKLFNSSIELEDPINFIQYRLYVLQGNTQIEIIPYTTINKTFYSNYFDLDISSLIPQTYYLQLIVNRNNITLGNGNIIKFNVVSEKS